MTRNPVLLSTRLVSRALAVFVLLGLAASRPAQAQDAQLDTKLKAFDAYMHQIVKDWNVPGIGVTIVVKDKVVFAKGYGFRDYVALPRLRDWRLSWSLRDQIGAGDPPQFPS